MWPVFGFFIFSVILGLFGQETTLCNPKACQKTDNQKPVCGSDGLSYPNKCQLELVRCQNKNVTFVKRGVCKRQRSCLEWEDLSLDFPQYRFKARCKKSGGYEPGQCHPETGYCWCVTPEGIPLPDTVKEKNEKPGSKPIRCGGGNRKKIARSPSRKTKNRVCKVSDKSILNNNLINSFHSEYLREFGQNNSDHVVIGWKFSSLDSNRDNVLDKREYRDIKRLVGKAMKPKKCAKSFPKTCDVDSDGRIAAEEWEDCLSKDGSNVATDVKSSSDSQDNDEGDDYDAPYDPLPAPPHGVLNPDSSGPPSLGQIDEDDVMDTREEESPGCLGDRKTALEEGNIAGHLHDATYIPECTPDGRYKKVQCYKSVGYCWCVNEENGQNIPGTSVKGQNPNCDLLKPPPEPMKGCADGKKIVFLQELMQFLHSKMSDSVTPNNPAGSIALIQSKEEQALWSFNFLDKNKNKVLEKSEWKVFKELVAPVKGLKKCGKKLPRYCDSNKDKVISTTEWLDCLNVQGLISYQQNVPKTPRTGKTNPLSLLKDD